MNRPSELHEPSPARRNVLAGAALGVSAVAALFAYLPMAFLISIVLGVAGLVLALLGRRAAAAPARRGRGHDMTTAAMWVAGFALLLGVLGAVAAWNASRLPTADGGSSPADHQER